MNADGTPDFALNHVEVTQDEAENGVHYYLVEAELFEAGYEEPLSTSMPMKVRPFSTPPCGNTSACRPPTPNPSP